LFFIESFFLINELINVVDYSLSFDNMFFVFLTAGADFKELSRLSRLDKAKVNFVSVLAAQNVVIRALRKYTFCVSHFFSWFVIVAFPVKNIV
jgi:hypothetical protein